MVQREWIRGGKQWGKAILFTIIVSVLMRTFLFSNYVVEGESMMPTIQKGNKLIVNKLGFHAAELKRFDVIIFHANPKEDYIKRIIGLPGDKIEYRNDKLFVNGHLMQEPFLNNYKKKSHGIKFTGDFTLKEVTGKNTVPPGKLFVLGDNRLRSWDSRNFGFVSESEVVGKVDLRYWPLDEINDSF